jgi:hypothetical protein
LSNSEFLITPEKIDKIVKAYEVHGIALRKDTVERIHREFSKLTRTIKGQYLAHITRVMENYFRKETGNPLFIIKYTPYIPQDDKTECSAAFYPGRRFVIFYPSNMLERELRVRLAHELGHLFLLASLENKKSDLNVPTYKGTTEPLSSIFGIFTISDKNHFYANAHESGRNHKSWDAVLEDFLSLPGHT